MLKKLSFALAIAALCAATAHAAPAQVPPAASASPALQYLVGKGLKIESHFSTPGDMTAYIGTIPNGEQVVFFIPRDGSVAIFGTMLDAHGNNLSKAFLTRYQRGPHAAQTYKNLEAADWIAEGAKHPRRIVYAFVDPDCPYCHQFWEKAQRYYNKGLQVRYVIVAILGKSSLHKAAAILAAANPDKALRTNERGFSHHSGAITPMRDIPDSLKSKIIEHNTLMQQFGFDGTPAMVWKTPDGAVKTENGLVPDSMLEDIFGVHPARH